MKQLTLAAALLTLSGIAGAETPELQNGSVQVIEGERVDVYEHRSKLGRERVDVDPKGARPYSFVGSEISDEGGAAAGESPNAPRQMWSIKKW
jgi:hypothetical protein